MLTRKRNVLLFSVCTLFAMITRGQSQIPISGDFKNIYFKEFVRIIEASHPYHFYYDTTQLDSLPVTIDANNTPISALLDKLFEKTNFHYAIDSINNIFIVLKRFPVFTALPPELFIVGKKITNEPDTITDAGSQPGIKQKINTSAENKLYEIGLRTNQPLTGSAILAGYVKDSKSGEGLVGASVYLDSSSIGTTTDQFGYYSLTLPRGRHLLQISSTGMKPTKRQLILYSNGKLTIELKDDVPTLKSVIVIAEKNSNVRRLQMGIERISIKTIKQLPALLGEPDVLRAILTLPGVTSVGEASSGFNVRGGSSDQNLILFNDATIYNSSHLFGFFSAFNADVIKNADLYKSSIPEKYGGRLSSVLDVTTRDGNNKKWTGNAGIGLLTTKFMVEGPLVIDKTSILIGGRTTYSNWLLSRLPGDDYSNSSAFFYDLNLQLTHTINVKNSLYVTFYSSSDKFRLNNDTTYKYSNQNLVVKWKHVFNNKLYATVSGGKDQYDYSVIGNKETIRSYKLEFGIDQYNIKGDFIYNLNNKHQFNFGLSNIYYKLQPGSFQPSGQQSLVIPKKVSPEQAIETAIYLGDRIALTDRLSINAGIRFVLYNYLGPRQTYSYFNGLSRDQATIKDSAYYTSGKIIKTYMGPEYRLSLRYSLSEQSSIKLSYNTLRQYIHLLSNTTSISPTDIWKLSDSHIKPQSGDQFSLGYYQNFESNTIETSVEVYYKRIKNYLDYKSGASIVLNQNIERDVINTKGRAYGAEFLIRKTTGKLNGWISYTYARIELQMDDPIAGQVINKGNYYPANFDKPHSVNVIGNYKFTHRYSISLSTQYSTGRPITLPIAEFNLSGARRLFYSQRNQYRVPDYFRMDFSVNLDGNHKVKQRTHGSWTLGVYNLTARKNVYSIYFVEENGTIKGYKLSVIGTAIPYITYNIRF